MFLVENEQIYWQWSSNVKFLAVKSQPDIVRKLKIAEGYNGSIAKFNKNGGPKRTAKSSEMVWKVQRRIKRNPKQCAIRLAKDLNV